MVLVETSVQTDPSSVPLAPSRSFCDPIEQSASLLCQPLPRPSSLENRRSVFRLEGSEGVYFPTDLHRESGDRESSKHKLCNTPSGSILAQSTMVPSDVEPTGRVSNKADSDEKVVESTKVKHIPYKTRNAGSSRVESIKNRLLSEGFSEEVASMADQPQRKSSWSVYQSHYATFCDWCIQRGISMESVSVQIVADYLYYMFDNLGCKVATFQIIEQPCQLS